MSPPKWYEDPHLPRTFHIEAEWNDPRHRNFGLELIIHMLTRLQDHDRPVRLIFKATDATEWGEQLDVLAREGLPVFLAEKTGNYVVICSACVYRRMCAWVHLSS